MPLPPDDIRAKLAQLRNEFAMRAALQSEYDKEMSGKYIHEMIPFSDWLAQRNAPTGKAHGGQPNLDVMRLAIGGQGPKNWLKGSVERVIEPLKVGPRDPDADFHYVRDETSPDGWRTVPNPPDPINLWIERNLGNYIRKQMATHDDPVRKLAEQGIVHMPPEQMGYGSSQAEMVRKKHGAPRLGQSEAAQAWENATDIAMNKIPVSSIDKKPFIGKSNWEPWMEKADPNTEVFYPTDNMHAHYLGFDHLVDILKEDLAQGRIRPEQLSKVSIEQAVRRAHQYDQERKKAMAETALKATESMPVHKDYGDGFKWIELTKPENVDESEYSHLTVAKPQGRKDFAVMDKNTDRLVSTGHKNPESAIEHIKDIAKEKKLADALKYEGDTMGHCVGGYCPDVSSGETRIFSLRDAKNEPHVTIEVKPPKYSDAPREHRIQYLDELKQQDPNADWSDEGFAKWMKNRGIEVPPAIKQIKGKGNAKPKKDYIPYVQDFVKSGNWSDVGDLRNTELKHISKVPEREQFEKAGMQLPQYLSDKEHDELINEYNRRTKPSFDPGFFDKAYGKAEGGITHAHHLEIEERRL